MRIGIDLDNTLICYDKVFVAVARAQGLPIDPSIQHKGAVRTLCRCLPDGEAQWQRIQGQVYGRHMPEAVPMPGVDSFVAMAKRAGRHLFVVSHKTRHGHFDPERIDLQKAARAWLVARGFLDPEHGIDPMDVFFEETRDAKVRRIATLALDAFIDDLPEVFEHPEFPRTVRAILYRPSGKIVPGPFETHSTWSSIAKEFC